MQILEIKVPDSKTLLVNEFLKELGVNIKVKQEKKFQTLILYRQ